MNEWMTGRIEEKKDFINGNGSEPKYEFESKRTRR